MKNSPSLFPTSPVILDGGFGTTLEELFDLNISESPLWSGQQILDNPGTIKETHLAFLRAGAQIILTSTYQCSAMTFERANISDMDAQSTMLKAVYLADDARKQFQNENPDVGDIKVALSLGAFGACLSPSQEFDGLYPPPYGPIGFSDLGEKSTSFGEDVQSELNSINSLARFHFDRLVVFSRDPKAWNAIDMIAFETVPLVREVKAIRTAMLWLHHDLAADATGNLKPWWISTVFPGGKCPETQYPGGPNLTTRDVVAAAFKKMGDASSIDPVPIPTGIGVNCTSPDVIPSVVGEIALAVKEYHDVHRPKPWLVLYPNGGDEYDNISRTWKYKTSKHKEHRWEFDLVNVVKDLVQTHPGIWNGVVLGGCCGTYPTQIRRLRDLVLNTGPALNLSPPA